MLKQLKNFYSTFYISGTTYIVAGVVAIIFVISYFSSVLFIISQAALTALFLLILFDLFLLYSLKEGLTAVRETHNRLHLGEKTEIKIIISNKYSFTAQLKVIDEVPPEFTGQQWSWRKELLKRDTGEIHYTVRPVQRGEFNFGDIRIFIQSPLKLLIRRYTIKAGANIPSYPSTLNLKKFALQAVAHSSNESGVKKLRRLGHSMEFEQIKRYVKGDDYRTINWKATARQTELMSNTFTEEKSQQVYCIIDRSRAMKMPFDGMTLLDYAVNSSLAVCNVALGRQDRAGLITFSEKASDIVYADRRAMQMEAIQRVLYNIKTNFKESNYEILYSLVRSRVKQRSLLILYTNFETLQSMQKRIAYLRALNHYHLLLVVFFENTGIKAIKEERAKTLEDVYIKTIADKFDFEKKLIVKELRRHGILSVLTTPANLTIDSINKYLELKTRNMI